MAYNRLLVEIPSMKRGVPNLTIRFIDVGEGWTLEAPSIDEIEHWLAESEIE